MSKSKERILTSAQELFHKNGFQQTSVDDILRESGVSKSNFYYHFKSKEELGLICLDMRIRQYEADVLEKTLKDPTLTPTERLSRFYKAVQSFHRKTKSPKGCPFGNLAIEMSGVNEKFRERLSDFFGIWQKAIEHCIAEGMNNGEFRSDIPPKTIAQLILSHLEGAVMMVKTHRSLKPLSSGSDTIMKLLEAA